MKKSAMFSLGLYVKNESVRFIYATCFIPVIDFRLVAQPRDVVCSYSDCCADLCHSGVIASGITCDYVLE